MRSISLSNAVLVSINIIIGAGLFVNPSPLTQIIHGWGFAAYLLSAVILLPLIICIATLATLKPTAGGLYVYAHDFVSPMAGFISGWCYFLGKSTSAAILAYTFCSFVQSLFFPLQNFSTKILTIFILFTLALANIAGLKIGGKVQWLFIALKTIPIALVLITGIFCARGDWPEAFPASALEHLPSALPIAIFALCGFEAICSIAHLIENPKKNVRRAILISFITVALASALFQFGMWQMLGPSLKTSHSAMMAYAHQMFGDHSWAAKIIYAFVYLSILGAAFGMLTSNCWNLQTIAKHKHLPGSHHLTLVSSKQVPWASLLVETSLASLIISLQSNQIPLQNMAVFGMTIGYLMSAVAAWKAASDGSHRALPRWLVVLSFVSCAYVLWLCATRIISSGASSLFLLILAAGIGAAMWQKHRRVSY